MLKKGFNITYSGDLTNLNQWINISAYNKCNFNWVDKKYFDNVYKKVILIMFIKIEILKCLLNNVINRIKIYFCYHI